MLRQAEKERSWLSQPCPRGAAAAISGLPWGNRCSVFVRAVLTLVLSSLVGLCECFLSSSRRFALAVPALRSINRRECSSELGEGLVTYKLDCCSLVGPCFSAVVFCYVKCFCRLLLV